MFSYNETTCFFLSFLKLYYTIYANDLSASVPLVMLQDDHKKIEDAQGLTCVRGIIDREKQTEILFSNRSD